MKKVFSIMGLLVMAMVWIFSYGTDSAFAAAYDRTDPIATGCARDAITVKSESIDSYGVIQLRYSPSCRTAWGKITLNFPSNYNVVGGKYGDAHIIRNSDGLSYGCTVPVGSYSCYTLQVNDSNVTSYAKGDIWRVTKIEGDGWSATGLATRRTGSY
ncbi:DUF2690 domain-containing protein [Bacillus arachidis]|uniref:DUF2690 domain-containing protein n=1 Tax=Bacillus arachidis TaxID=2819290 RepID=A0ABS3P6Y8_9BACI|nr:DUF2690 domain-containing protein [Bacillus arachidis]MBO1628590.1 DUF2690 domain-containing protein [Bacillus arachidis]